MKKSEALGLFDGNGAALGRALGVGRAAISKLPPDLDRPTTMKIVGCAVLLGLVHKLPDRFVRLAQQADSQSKAA